MTTNKAALEAEAKSETLREFEYKSKKYVVESDSEQWSIETMLAYEEGKGIGVVRAVLGPDQWQRFMNTKPTNKDFSDFAELLFNTLGITEGELPG